MHYLPYRTNPFAQETPEFGRRPNYEGSMIRDHFTTKADGSFRLLGLPGKAVVGAAVVSGPNRYMVGAGSESLSLIGRDRLNRRATYTNPYAPGPDWPTVMKEIEPPADAKTAHVDLEALEGDSVRVRVVDPADRPISDLETLGRDGMAFRYRPADNLNRAHPTARSSIFDRTRTHDGDVPPWGARAG